MGLFRRSPAPMKWSVVVAAPKGDAGAQWGDTWFAHDLVDALQRAGQSAKVVFRGAAESEARESDDVVLVLRGLRRVNPRRGSSGSSSGSSSGGATWMLWIISHPELVESDEPAQYDAVFAASQHWSRATSFGIEISPLLQATNAHRFTPTAAQADSGAAVLFAGSTRGEYRPAVRACVEAGIELSLYGVGWDEFLAPDMISGEFIPNDQLPAAYASASVVLNDHWPDMAAEGFLSNRLFDAVATGTRVLSDDAVGLREVFDSSVCTYDDPSAIPAILDAPYDSNFAPHAERLGHAARIAREHSFDARAHVLIDRALALRGRR